MCHDQTRLTQCFANYVLVVYDYKQDVHSIDIPFFQLIDGCLLLIFKYCSAHGGRQQHSYAIFKYQFFTKDGLVPDLGRIV